MALILSFEQIKGIVPISQNIHVPTKVDPQIQLAQDFDIKPFLGEKLFYDFLFNISEDRFVRLLNGVEEYEHEDGKYKFEGLKHAISWYAYARIAATSKVQSTAQGMTNFSGSNTAELLNEKSLNRLVSQAESVAYGYLQSAADYIRRHEDDFKNWTGFSEDGRNKKARGSKSLNYTSAYAR